MIHSFRFFCLAPDRIWFCYSQIRWKGHSMFRIREHLIRSIRAGTRAGWATFWLLYLFHWCSLYNLILKVPGSRADNIFLFFFFFKVTFSTLFLFFFLPVYLFIYFWLCWVFVSVQGLSLVAASGGHSSSRCAGLSLSWPLLLRSTGSRRAGSAAVAHGPSCSTACGIFPDQGSNLCPLHWQADSQPLRHQGSPNIFLQYISMTWLFH